MISLILIFGFLCQPSKRQRNKVHRCAMLPDCTSITSPGKYKSFLWRDIWRGRQLWYFTTLPARRMTITCHKLPSLDIIFTTMKKSFALKNYLCQWNEKTGMIFIWKKTVYAEWGTEDLSLIWWHHFHIFLLSFGRQSRRDDPRHRKNFQSFQFQCHAYHSG